MYELRNDASFGKLWLEISEESNWPEPLPGRVLSIGGKGKTRKWKVLAKAIRRGRYKFVHSPVDPDQLYDLQADSDERRNLAADAGQAQVLEAFRAEVARRWDLKALHESVLLSQRRRRLVYESLRKGRYTPWDFQPNRDASKLYIRNDQDLPDLEAMARFPPLGPIG